MPTPQAPTPTITIEDVAQYPRPGTAIPTGFAFSPDDALITYLHSAEGTLTQQLYAFDPATGDRRLLVNPAAGGETEETLSLEEKLRRERARSRALGVTRYVWAARGSRRSLGSRLLIPLNGEVHVQDGPDAPLRKIVSNDNGPALDPRFSPDGSAVAYVQDAELYVVSADGETPRQLTEGARGIGRTHGLAEYTPNGSNLNFSHNVVASTLESCAVGG